MTLQRPHVGRPRGSVLLVGPSQQRDRLVPESPPDVVAVDTLFDALGELTDGRIRTPVHTILLAPGDPEELTQERIAAFRRLDPAVRIVLVAEPDVADRLGKQILNRFDSLLTGPLTEQQLSQATDVFESPSSAPEIVVTPHLDPPTPAPVITPPARPEAPATEPEPQSSSQPETPTPAPSSEVAPTPSEPTPTPSQVQEVGSEEQLGDIDLVDQILKEDGDLLNHALRLVKQQTQWTNCAVRAVRGDFEGATAPIQIEGRRFGLLSADDADPAELQSWADWLARWLQLDLTHRQLHSMAMEDDLTGAGNRRFFYGAMQDAIIRSNELRRPFAVMLFDIDNFKLFNDTFGHEAGDEILCETVRLLRAIVRRGDHVCRIGGDEFVVIFSDPEGPRKSGPANLESVEQIARRFQDQICQMRFPKLGHDAPGNLSVSGGLALYPWDAKGEGSEIDTLLHRADQRALISKRSGKNKITLGPPQQSSEDR